MKTLTRLFFPSMDKEYFMVEWYDVSMVESMLSSSLQQLLMTIIVQRLMIYAREITMGYRKKYHYFIELTIAIFPHVI